MSFRFQKVLIGPTGRHVIAPTVRSGVKVTRKPFEAETRDVHAGPSDLATVSQITNHDLTVAAIAWRPFGPHESAIQRFG